ncbi:UDP-glucose pyrophosphorylase isoform X2 [Oratosquilla oratoria]|uniref:UDP-glucose pyrophosphorylase isoform X2 n=1 Tax=Oratosquilla oratoria TaxID=337810 RepID=UPI003F757F1C
MECYFLRTCSYGEWQLGRNGNTTPSLLPSFLASATETSGKMASAENRREVFSHGRSPSREFKEMTKKEAEKQLEQELENLKLTCTSEGQKHRINQEFEGFRNLFSRFINSTGSAIQWNDIKKLPSDKVQPYSYLVEPASNMMKTMLDKLVVVKLNGGLGTSMGCQGPKSLISVRNELTFLDLTVQQIQELNKTYGCSVPLVLMNSFNTEEDTKKVIRKYSQFEVRIDMFNQSMYPRINKESLMPLASSVKNDPKNQEAWYPPGHGDFYYSFKNSGLLDKYLAEGKEYIFISNIDNLGATVDLNLVNFLMGEGSTKPEFVMEVTDKTRADVKGGTLVWYENKLRLLEIAQVPKDHVDDFKSVQKFKIFNTNNLWVKLDAIDRVLKDGTLEMDVIINNKTLDNGLNIIQLEQAVGAAMKCFEGCVGINVPRSRFLPVKKTDDLLLVKSNLYDLTEGSLTMSNDRNFKTTPLIKLGPNHFGKVKEFSKRFASIPDMLELDHLTVSGDVTFGKGVSLKGTVIIIANHGDRIDIPDGAQLENKIVSGNLRILDH